MNPGLPSRFPIHLHFPDFSKEQLMQITEKMLRERQYRLSLAAAEKFKNHLINMVSKSDQPFGNARYIRNVIEQAIRHHAVRLLRMRYPSKDELMTIHSEDLVFSSHRKEQKVHSWYN
jgi:stage V sporulation protein K